MNCFSCWDIGGQSWWQRRGVWNLIQGWVSEPNICKASASKRNRTLQLQCTTIESNESKENGVFTFFIAEKSVFECKVGFQGQVVGDLWALDRFIADNRSVTPGLDSCTVHGIIEVCNKMLTGPKGWVVVELCTKQCVCTGAVLKSHICSWNWQKKHAARGLPRWSPTLVLAALDQT